MATYLERMIAIEQPRNIWEAHDRVCALSATLPFIPNEATWVNYLSAMDRTMGNWKTWFAPAQQADKIERISLGTLRYLPWEVRRHMLAKSIVQHFLDNPVPFFNGWVFAVAAKSHKKPDFNLYPWAPTIHVRRASKADFEHIHAQGFDTIHGLTQASQKLRNEFIGALVSNHTFLFECPSACEGFLTSPMVVQAEYKGRMKVSLLMLADPRQGTHKERLSTDRWQAAFDVLPLNLGQLDIYIGFRRLAPEEWEKHFQTFDDIVKTARRCAPSAKVSIRSKYRMKYQDDPPLQDAIIRGMKQLARKHGSAEIMQRYGENEILVTFMPPSCGPGHRIGG